MFEKCLLALRYIPVRMLRRNRSHCIAKWLKQSCHCWAQEFWARKVMKESASLSPPPKCSGRCDGVQCPLQALCLPAAASMGPWQFPDLIVFPWLLAVRSGFAQGPDGSQEGRGSQHPVTLPLEHKYQAPCLRAGRTIKGPPRFPSHLWGQETSVQSVSRVSSPPLPDPASFPSLQSWSQGHAQ